MTNPRFDRARIYPGPIGPNPDALRALHPDGIDVIHLNDAGGIAICVYAKWTDCRPEQHRLAITVGTENDEGYVADMRFKVPITEFFGDIVIRKMSLFDDEPDADWFIYPVRVWLDGRLEWQQDLEIRRRPLRPGEVRRVL